MGKFEMEMKLLIYFVQSFVLIIKMYYYWLPVGISLVRKVYIHFAQSKVFYTTQDSFQWSSYFTRLSTHILRTI